MAETKEVASCISDVVRSMTEAGALEVKPCTLDFSDSSRFTRLELSESQKLQFSGLLQHIPAIAGVVEMSQAYIVKFPKGIPHTLVALNGGGYASMVRGENGKFLAHAHLYPISGEAMVLGAFTAMSVVSGQYFLAQINDKLGAINQDVKSILGFLYGDKRAELLSELRFVQYAYQNYSSIMEHEHQRTATITSIQDAKKVAMKDMAFYLQDLSSFVEDNAKTEKIAERISNLHKSLELTIQLYVMSNLLELHYAQNFDPNYVKQMEKDVTDFIETCYDHMRYNFGQLKGQLTEKKGPLGKKKEEYVTAIDGITNMIESLEDHKKSKMKLIHNSLYQPTQKATYYLSHDGDIYTAVQ